MTDTLSVREVAELTLGFPRQMCNKLAMLYDQGYVTALRSVMMVRPIRDAQIVSLKSPYYSVVSEKQWKFYTRSTRGVSLTP